MPTTNVEDGQTARRTPSRTARSGRRTRETRLPEPDAVCVQAVDQARRAAQDVAGHEAVGDHIGTRCEGVRLITHFFTCRSRGYRGWQWAVTVARASRARAATVCETHLLPGDGAILAPPWVPWAERLAPGDIGPHDVLPYLDDDPLLVQGYQQTAPQDEDCQSLWEMGLGRLRVLGRLGRQETATRWYSGEHGPTAPEALHAGAACSSCGYFVPLSGSLKQVFGVCANRWSSSDGRVVSVDHGCGAHSETDIERNAPQPLPEPILDETGVDPFCLSTSDTATASDPAPDTEPDQAPGTDHGQVTDTVPDQVPDTGQQTASGQATRSTASAPPRRKSNAGSRRGGRRNSGAGKRSR